MLREKAKAIRLLILDVDGTLTNGHLYYDVNGEHLKCFHVHDGLGIQLLQKCGVEIAVISSKKSDAVLYRLNQLGIKHIYLGQDKKLLAYHSLKQQLQLHDNHVAYMGDDLPDLPLLRRAGLAITVPQAPEVIRKRVDFITVREAGNGAVREACEFIMIAKELYQSLIESYDI
ncbi:MAG TPA: HAD-IIIA family hydrolase [Gammaproteobacteria bacterium]|nr:HAD-IIIA family hydrolase [Gammaproteobacteria bacterium]